MVKKFPRDHETGRIVIRADDPLYPRFNLRPSPEALAAIKRMDEVNAAAWANVRNMVFGDPK